MTSRTGGGERGCPEHDAAAYFGCRSHIHAPINMIYAKGQLCISSSLGATACQTFPNLPGF